MKRAFLSVGLTSLTVLNLFVFINTSAIKAIFITAFVAFIISLFIPEIRRHGLLPTVLAAIMFCCILFGVNSLAVEKKTQGLTDRNRLHYISGTVTSLRQTDNGMAYYTVRTETVDGKRNVQNIRLELEHDIDASPYSVIRGNVHTYRPGVYSRDIENHYLSKGFYLSAYPENSDDLAVSERSGFHPMYYVLKIKSALKETVLKNAPNEYGGLLTGLLLGEKYDMDEETLGNFMLIGTYHLLAVSGLHITVWTGFVYSLLRALHIRRKLSGVLLIAFIVFFASLTGFNPPVVRAGTLMIFVFAGSLFKREADSLNSIGIAVTLMLLINPFAALSKGLWLSVFSSFGIILVSGKMYEKLNFTEFNSGFPEFLKCFILQSLAVSASVALFTLPLSFLFFERFSLLTPVSNLLLIEIASFTMLLAGFASVFGVFGLGFVSEPLFFAASAGAKVIVETADFLSSIPYITVPTDNTVLRIIAFSLPAVCFLIYCLKKKIGASKHFEKT